MRTLRIGLFGHRGAGKTVALSVTYLTEASDGLAVTVRDADTVRYLRPLAEGIERGQVPAPTMKAAPTFLKWSARIGGADHEIETIDFAGELLDVVGDEGDPVTEQVVAQYRAGVRDWFTRCDAVVLFVDGTDPGTARYRDALVWLLDEMARHPTAKGAWRRAVAVVFTKADCLTAGPEETTAPDQAEAVLARHPLYEIVRRRLGQYPEEVRSRVFLASALGWQFATVPDLARRRVQPCNLFAALRWALEEAAGIVRETHSQELDDLERRNREHAHGGFPVFGPLFAAVKRRKELDDADLAYQFSTGPHAARFRALGEEVRRNKRRQLVRLSAGAIVVALGIGYGVWHGLRQAPAAIYDQFDRLAEGPADDAGAERRLAYYTEQIAGRGSDRFWNLGDRRRAARVRAGLDVLAVWAGEDGRLRAAGRHPQRHLSAHAWLDGWGHVLTRDQANTIRAAADDAAGAYAAERAAWAEVAALPARRPAECEAKCDRLRAYLARADALSTDQAGGLLATTLQEWDRQEYAGLAELWRATAAPNYFGVLAAAAGGYLRDGRHPHAMRGPVFNLLGQIEAMKGTREYTVLVEKVSIPAGSELDGDIRGSPNCSVRVEVGPEARQTGRVKPAAGRDPDGGFTITFNEQLDPLPLVGGEHKSARVVVTTHRWLFPNNVAAVEVTDELMPLARLNGPVGVTCGRGKTVTVHFKCPAACLDPLPPFVAP